ncbi:unnamed protein product [marine sediment metagenome]|uniref:Uncharacterized protein n=1 Tax=marine sediment metagenome TaxID=412755 RepID=X1JVE8_9ZZZZ
MFCEVFKITEQTEDITECEDLIFSKDFEALLSHLPSKERWAIINTLMVMLKGFMGDNYHNILNQEGWGNKR